MEAKLSHQSLERGLRVIEAISDFGGSASVSAIARKTELPRSTVHHLLRSLIAFGYLLQEGEAQPYKLAPRLFKLTVCAWTQGQLAEISVPFIEELSRRTGEGTSLAILREGVVSVVAKRDSEGPVRVVQKVGTVRPIYCTAVGKILAAWLPEREIDDIIGRIVFERMTGNDNYGARRSETGTRPHPGERICRRQRGTHRGHPLCGRPCPGPFRKSLCGALYRGTKEPVFSAQTQGTSHAPAGRGE